MRIPSVLEGFGQDWIRTSEGVSQRIYSPPRLATSVPTLWRLRAEPVSYRFAGGALRGSRTMDFITIFGNGKSLLFVDWLLM